MNRVRRAFHVCYQSEESDSKANEGEVKIVCRHLSSLILAGVKPEDIAVISPYNLQVCGGHDMV